jgi:hypothetical protein
MSDQFRNTWETYASSWNSASEDARRGLFESSLDAACRYTDPLAQTEGWDALADYMRVFQTQIPGGHFVTTYFLAHHGKSIAKWEMRDGADATVGEGISYGDYGPDGKLIAMTGFFETPAS